MKKEQARKILALVKRNYQEIALGFDATRRKELWPEAKRLAEEVEEEDEVLDAGCGNGRLLEAWPDKKINYAGFDSSAQLVAIARRNYPGREFFVADILEPASWSRIAGRSFDHIFCLAVLPHIPGKELRQEALRNLAARLKPDGRLIVSAWNLWSGRKYRPLIFRSYWHKILGRNELDLRDLIFPWRGASGQGISQRYYHAFTRRELERLAASAGLGIISRNKDNHNYWLILKNK